MKPGKCKVHWIIAGSVFVALLLIVLIAIGQKGESPGLATRLGTAIGVLRMKKAPSGPAQAVFRQYVLDPIPESVKDIRVDRTRAVFGYGYTFRFKINPADLSMISTSRPFHELAEMEYSKHSTHLRWKLSSGPRTSMFVYSPGQHGPRWFKPEDMDSPEGYALPEGEWDTRILIYDRRLEEAYLIIRR